MGYSSKGSRSLAVNNPDLAKEWDYDKNAPLTPDAITFGSAKKVWWKCLKPYLCSNSGLPAGA